MIDMYVIITSKTIQISRIHLRVTTIAQREAHFNVSRKIIEILKLRLIKFLLNRAENRRIYFFLILN